MHRTAKTQFLLGQSFGDARLIYSVRLGAGDDVHLIDSERNAVPLLLAPAHYKELTFSQVVRSDGAQAMVPLRWSPASVTAYVAGAHVNASTVLRAVRRFIKRYYAAANEAHYDVLSLYVLASYVFTVAETVPYLSIVGEPATGKTLLGELLELLLFNGRMSASITAAALFHYVGLVRSTLIIDEQNRGDSRWTEVARAGYRRSGRVAVVDRRNEGVREWDCFGPKVFLSNEPLADEALRTRAITLQSESSTAPRERYSTRSVLSEVEALRDELHMFGLQHAPAISRVYESLQPIDALTDRDQDLAALLIAIAGHADEDSDTDTSVRGSLIAFLSDQAATKRSRRITDSEQLAHCRLILEYLSEGHGHARPDGAVRATSYLDFLHESRVLNYRPTQREVTEKLRRWKLADRRVLDVHDPLDSDTPDDDITRQVRKRRQRPFYVFNEERARHLLEVHRG